MRVKFQDVECYRDYQYEYTDYENSVAHKEFTVWNPVSLDDIKKEEEKPKAKKETPVETDIYTEMFAQELGLRSLKNQSSSSDVEQLDLSFLDYDVIDWLDGDMNTTLDVKETKSKREYKKFFSNWKELDASNLTAVNLVNQSISENTTHMQNSSTLYKSENTTVFYSPNILLKNDSLTTNSSASVVASNLDTKNTTVHSATTLSKVGNVFTETNNLTVTLQETTNLTVTSRGNTSSVLDTGRMNVTLTGDNQTSVGSTLPEDSEERLTRGDVFSYSVPVYDSSTNNLHSTPEVSVTSLSSSTKKEDENNTATNHVNVSADGTNHSFSIPAAEVGEVDISSTDRRNLTMESTDNKTSNNGSLITAAELEHGLQINSSETVTILANYSLENATHILLETGPLQNITVNISRSNSSGEISSESRENVTALLGELNRTSSAESVFYETVSLSNAAVRESNSAELIASDSSEELFIYLKEKNTEGIKTTSVKTQGHNWTYEGTHQIEPMKIPDDIMKYFVQETPQTTPTPKKKTRKVNLRQRPQKGQGMKTKKRKEYKPQARSGLPFSPRGFNPGMSPRGSRPNVPQPVSDEDDLINMPVVIGVPRPDFSDYELYVPGDEPQHLRLDEQDVKANEYEYVVYKDPYSSHEDIKNLNLDETTKYYLKFSGPNVNTYFIAAEEVEWDYAGYGQR